MCYTNYPTIGSPKVTYPTISSKLSTHVDTLMTNFMFHNWSKHYGLLKNKAVSTKEVEAIHDFDPSG